VDQQGSFWKKENHIKSNTNRIAILIPCRNEAISIEKVIKDFQMVLPQAEIFIGDNNSTDSTAELSRRLGCHVVFEYMPGKGNVVRRLLREVDADYYIIVDGDDTYDPRTVIIMLAQMEKFNLDMVIARRKTPKNALKLERNGHHFGNKIIGLFFNFLLNSKYKDVLSGYRVLNADFAKSFPSKSTGFEIEVEMNAHASWMNASVLEVDSEYSSRNDGSTSKLNTFRDGYKIAREIFVLSRRSKPIRHFFVFFSPIFAVSVILIARAMFAYLDSGRVEYIPSLVVGMGMLVLFGVLWSSFLVMEQSISNQLTLVNIMRRNKKNNE